MIQGRVSRKEAISFQLKAIQTNLTEPLRHRKNNNQPNNLALVEEVYVILITYLASRLERKL